MGMLRLSIKKSSTAAPFFTSLMKSRLLEKTRSGEGR